MDFGKAIMDVIVNVSSQYASSVQASVCYGQVTSLDPLRIKIQEVDRESLELGDGFLVLSEFCKDKWIELPKHGGDDKGNQSHVHDESEELINVTAVTASGEAVSFSPGGTTLTLRHKHTIHDALPKILLWRGLKVGDDVIMLKLPPKKFFVLQRVEMTNDTE
jgi:hypothetical protein